MSNWFEMEVVAVKGNSVHLINYDPVEYITTEMVVTYHEEGIHIQDRIGDVWKVRIK